jgi:HPt (histidine-containing phosphotransfer) domain-containing protein
MSLQDVLAGLQKNYLASMPEKIARIESLFSAKSFDELESEYHKLKGTGRTYGIPEITDLGAAMEQMCGSHLKSLSEMVPVSVQLIKNITEARIKGNAYDLAANEDFKRLIKIIA